MRGLARGVGDGGFFRGVLYGVELRFIGFDIFSRFGGSFRGRCFMVFKKGVGAIAKWRSQSKLFWDWSVRVVMVLRYAFYGVCMISLVGVIAATGRIFLAGEGNF